DGDELRYDKKDSIYKRFIKSFKRISDVTVTSMPAYQDTDVAPVLRSIEHIEKQSRNQIEKEKMLFELEMLDYDKGGLLMEGLIEKKLDLKESRVKFEDKKNEVREALESDDLIKARKLKEELDELKTHIDSLSKEVDELTNEQDEEKTEDNTDDEGEER